MIYKGVKYSRNWSLNEMGTIRDLVAQRQANPEHPIWAALRNMVDNNEPIRPEVDGVTLHDEIIEEVFRLADK